MTLSRFHEALATAADERQFAHVPVDWWDGPAQRWRPTVIERACADQPFWHAHVLILAPVIEGLDRDLVAVMPRRVRIADLRPSKLIDEQIARFFSTRYTLEMLDALMPCIDRVSIDEQTHLRGIADEVVAANHEAYVAWVRAFTTGATEAESVSSRMWTDRAIDEATLPRSGGRDVFAVIDRERRSGGIACSPVAMWDESARRWRPTILLDANRGENQFTADHEDRVLIPGEPVDVALVPGSLLQPIDLTETCFSLLAIPVLARDYLRVAEALAKSGLSSAAVASHPTIIAFARMLSGAAEEWRGVYDEGLLGPAPEPRVAPLPPSMWGFTSDSCEALSGDDRV